MALVSLSDVQAVKLIGSNTSLGCSNGGIARCCGYGQSYIAAQASASNIYQNGFLFTINIQSNGHCGAPAPATWQQPTMFGQVFDFQQIYDVDDRGCSGGNWNIGGHVHVISLGNEGNVWLYSVMLTSIHGGVGGQCQCKNRTSFIFCVTQP